MGLGSLEHEEIMKSFEALKPRGRLDREPKESWARGVIYQDGAVNELFLMYRHGYSAGRCEYLHRSA